MQQAYLVNSLAVMNVRAIIEERSTRRRRTNHHQTAAQPANADSSAIHGKNRSRQEIKRDAKEQGAYHAGVF
jgi:hypothetical protein